MMTLEMAGLDCDFRGHVFSPCNQIRTDLNLNFRNKMPKMLCPE
jgi:hypothetical protein